VSAIPRGGSLTLSCHTGGLVLPCFSHGEHIPETCSSSPLQRLEHGRHCVVYLRVVPRRVMAHSDAVERPVTARARVWSIAVVIALALARSKVARSKLACKLARSKLGPPNL
jgi:hypothetical protein